jgi:hypothetical protein
MPQKKYGEDDARAVERELQTGKLIFNPAEAGGLYGIEGQRQVHEDEIVELEAEVGTATPTVQPATPAQPESPVDPIQ